ncbi:unnamed protein product [Ilex paraguariensis]|uniref:Senescence regulator n=1 Tax=Ilex paraguariensis TaxID=185542 RepID=A0ABC8U4P6_9AQUA
MADESVIIKKSKSGKSLRDDEDLQEEEVWAVMKEREETSLKMRTAKDSSGSSSSAWRFPSVPRAIQRSNNGGREAHVQPQQLSAHMNIPDWAKIYKKKSKGLRDDSCGDEDGAINDVVNVDECVDDVENDDDDGDEEMVPPHEYIARKFARTQIASFSMCEGVGRTLKGRDLSKLRNAILTKTGYLENDRLHHPH